MYSTRTRVHTRIPNGHPREEKHALDKSPPTSRSCMSGSWRAELAARASRPAVSGAAGCAAVGLPRHTPRQATLTSAYAGHRGHADYRARILVRKTARKSVSVPWNLSLTRLWIFIVGSYQKSGVDTEVCLRKLECHFVIEPSSHLVCRLLVIQASGS